MLDCIFSCDINNELTLGFILSWKHLICSILKVEKASVELNIHDMSKFQLNLIFRLGFKFCMHSKVKIWTFFWYSFMEQGITFFQNKTKFSL